MIFVDFFPMTLALQRQNFKAAKLMQNPTYGQFCMITKLEKSFKGILAREEEERTT